MNFFSLIKKNYPTFFLLGLITLLYFFTYPNFEIIKNKKLLKNDESLGNIAYVYNPEELKINRVKNIAPKEIKKIFLSKGKQNRLQIQSEGGNINYIKDGFIRFSHTSFILDDNGEVEIQILLNKPQTLSSISLIFNHKFKQLNNKYKSDDLSIKLISNNNKYFSKDNRFNSFDYYTTELNNKTDSITINIKNNKINKKSIYLDEIIIIDKSYNPKIKIQNEIFNILKLITILVSLFFSGIFFMRKMFNFNKDVNFSLSFYIFSIFNIIVFIFYYIFKIANIVTIVQIAFISLGLYEFIKNKNYIYYKNSILFFISIFLIITFFHKFIDSLGLTYYAIDFRAYYDAALRVINIESLTDPIARKTFINRNFVDSGFLFILISSYIMLFVGNNFEDFVHISNVLFCIPFVILPYFFRQVFKLENYSYLISLTLFCSCFAFHMSVYNPMKIFNIYYLLIFIVMTYNIFKNNDIFNKIRNLFLVSVINVFSFISYLSHLFASIIATFFLQLVLLRLYLIKKNTKLVKRYNIVFAIITITYLVVVLTFDKNIGYFFDFTSSKTDLGADIIKKIKSFFYFQSNNYFRIGMFIDYSKFSILHFTIGSILANIGIYFFMLSIRYANISNRSKFLVLIYFLSFMIYLALYPERMHVALNFYPFFILGLAPYIFKRISISQNLKNVCIIVLIENFFILFVLYIPVYFYCMNDIVVFDMNSIFFGCLLFLSIMFSVKYFNKV